jgi:hypothetical protein
MSKNIILVPMYHRHKLLDPVCLPPVLFHDSFLTSSLAKETFLGLRVLTLFLPYSFSLCLFPFFVFLNSLNGEWSPTGSTRHGGHWLAYCGLSRVIMMMENLVEWRLAGETEVLGENPPQLHFFHHKSHLTRPGIEPGPPRWEASD